jgi:hypothetical protein
MCKYYIILTYLIICLLISFIMYFKFKNCNIIEFYEGNSFRAGVCKTCEDGEIVNSEKSGCESCPDGWAGTDGACNPCGNGNQPNGEKTDCEPCPAGTAGIGGYCDINCENNQISNGDRTSCTTCDSGKQPNSSKTDCEPCPAGTYGENGYCHSCSNKHYLFAYSSIDGSTSCSMCPMYQIANRSKTGCVATNSEEGSAILNQN